MNKKKYLILVIALVVLVGAIFLFLKMRSLRNPTNGNKLPPSTTASTQTTFAERTQSIRDLLAQKLGQPVDNIQVSIAQEDQKYMKGIVTIADPAGQTVKVNNQDIKLPKIQSEGIFLAAKTGADWEIVSDGQTKYTCAAVSSYNFPVAMVGDCQK